MSDPEMNRVILVVLDSLGVGAARDSSRFGDQSANTLAHIGEWCSKNFQSFKLPNLESWGLGNLCPTFGVNAVKQPKASLATLEELSPGKDTTTGHWEMAGHVLKYEFPVFENGFSEQIMNDWMKQCGLKGFLGNKPASGTTILDELAEQHIKTGFPIVYTSGDSVFQIACHETHFGLEKLYEICKVARKVLDPLGVGRVIARPFLGEKVGSFKRTENRRDFSVPPPFPTILDVLKERGDMVAGVGKIEDIFAHRGLTIVEHTGRNETSLDATLDLINKTKSKRGLIFTNLIDFDQLHGHRRNPKTYAEALMDFDKFLPKLEQAMGSEDLLVLTADHGNDPTHSGSDHTRENVPLLFFTKSKSFTPKNHGAVAGFTAVARLVMDCLGHQSELSKMPDTLNTKALWVET